MLPVWSSSESSPDPESEAHSSGPDANGNTVTEQPRITDGRWRNQVWSLPGEEAKCLLFFTRIIVIYALLQDEVWFIVSGDAS